MKMTMEERFKDLVKLPFSEVQKECPYMTYGDYQGKRLLFGIDKSIVKY